MKTEILQLIAAEANISSADIVLDNTLEDDLMLDSLSMLSLQMGIEDKLDIKLKDDEWLRCRTVQDVITLAGEQLATH